MFAHANVFDLFTMYDVVIKIFSTFKFIAPYCGIFLSQGFVDRLLVITTLHIQGISVAVTKITVIVRWQYSGVNDVHS